MMVHVIIAQLKSLGARLIKRSGHGRGRIDAARESFSHPPEKKGAPGPQYLREKIRTWRAQRAIVAPQSYGEGPAGFSWRRAMLLGGSLAAVIGLFVALNGRGAVTKMLAGMDYFRISRIEIHGCVNSSAEKVRQSAGIKISTSLLAADAEAIGREIRAANHWVREVKISRRWPDVLLVTVNEYEPYALIALGTGKQAALHYLDRQGVPFIEAGAGMELDFPVITGLESKDPGQRQEKLAAALEFLGLIGANNPNLPAQSVSEIHIDEHEGLVIHLVEYPFPIFFGSGRVRENYYKLRKVLEVLYKQDKSGAEIARVAYIKMDYLNDKVIVGYSKSG